MSNDTENSHELNSWEERMQSQIDMIKGISGIILTEALSKIANNLQGLKREQRERWWDLVVNNLEDLKPDNPTYIVFSTKFGSPDEKQYKIKIELVEEVPVQKVKKWFKLW